MARAFETIPTPASVDGLTPDVLAATGRNPDFQSAVALHCESRVQAQAEMDGLTRWMSRDIGRFGLAAALTIIDGQPGGVTAASLFQVAQVSGGPSRGRITKFIERAQAEGGLSIPSGDDHWTRRRLIVRPKLVDPLMAHSATWLRSAARLFPQIEACFDRLHDPAWMVPYITVAAVLSLQARHLLATPERPMQLFLNRDRGMAIFCDLFSRQPAQRSRLLEAAPLSRKGLAARTGVSRTQIQRLLSDGEARGLLTSSTDSVNFTEPMSKDAGRYFALSFHVTRIAVDLLPLAMAHQAAAAASGLDAGLGRASGSTVGAAAISNDGAPS